MYVVTVSTGTYQADKSRVDAMTAEAWAAVLAAVDPLTESALPSLGKMKSGEYWSFAAVVTLPEAKILCDALGTMEVSRIRGLYSEHTPQQILNDASLYERAKTDITISVAGGVALPNVATVTYLEDCCTDVLQKHLDDGWRILAVCPPNDARRPTYIVGHAEPGRRGP